MTNLPPAASYLEWMRLKSQLTYFNSKACHKKTIKHHERLCLELPNHRHCIKNLADCAEMGTALKLNHAMDAVACMVALYHGILTRNCSRTRVGCCVNVWKCSVWMQTPSYVPIFL